jgi:high-affinity iron transporter
MITKDIIHRLPIGAKLLSFTLLLMSNSWAAAENVDTRQLLQLSEYISVDYSAAVSKGKVIDKGEYQEMLEFSTLIAEKANEMPSSNEYKSVSSKADQLKLYVGQKREASAVTQVAASLRDLLLRLPGQEPLPIQIASVEKARFLYAENCSGCHGATGHGDGVLAKSLSPMPTDFTDVERAKNRSVLGLYDVLSEGIEGTAMPPFKHLDKSDRWSLAFYVGSLPNAANSSFDPIEGISFNDLVTQSPNSLLNDNADLTSGAIFRSRLNPAHWLESNENPLVITRAKLTQALTQYNEGRFSEAKRSAVSAYLDGFELIENGLDAHSTELRKEIEKSLMDFRRLIAQENSSEALNSTYTKSLALIAQAEILLTEHTLSNQTLFLTSLVILLREGLEALLVVITLGAILLRSRRKDALKYVHAGWITALIAGGFTWWATRSLINFSGASREVVEGGAALFAALVLFYVGYWMHGKSQVGEWQKYIKKKLTAHLSAGTLSGIAVLSFVAVYREVFETILFYQSLVSQAGSAQHSVILWGLLSGALLLAVFGWLFIKYSIKLPIAKFLSVTTFILLTLSFILMGKAIAALQEAAVISVSPLPFDIAFSWLGIYSTWEGAAAQLTIILLAAGMLRRKSRTKKADNGEEILHSESP